MGVSAWISVTFLLISAAIAVPTGDHRKATLNIASFTSQEKVKTEKVGSVKKNADPKRKKTRPKSSAQPKRSTLKKTAPSDGPWKNDKIKSLVSRLATSINDTKDLNAESSEIISEAVAPPPGLAQQYQEPEAAASDDHTDHSIELVGGSQTFFPTFANLFEPRQQNNFRLGFNNQEAAYSQRPNSYRSLLNYPLFGGYNNRNQDNFGKQSTPTAAPLVEASSSLLGSGNFGIIRGGTFFAQNDEDEFGDGYNSYYNNGHGRPSYELGYIANPRPNYNQDQFANFRDFADINSPSNSAYSHYVVVYANKNSTMDEISEETRRVLSKPKNIIETLERIDKTTSAPKLSKAKSKLEATKQKMLNKKEQWKKTNSKFVSQKHDAEEPLLALS